MNEIELTMEEAAIHAQNEAEKLADRLDRDNAATERKPLMTSRAQFVALMTSTLAKVLVHHRVLKT